VPQAAVAIREHGTSGWISIGDISPLPEGTAGSTVHMEAQITQTYNERKYKKKEIKFQSSKEKCNEQM
jgi:hypothetical protein